MGVLATVVLVTLFVSAFCSLLESALYSTRVATLEAAKADGRRGPAAAQLLRMKHDIAVPTSAILILNTVANTAGATIAGMYAAELFGATWVAAFSAVLTVLILFFSEILPKTFGATHWKALWFFITWPLVGLEKALYPLVWVTQLVTRFVTRGATATTVTEDEIRATLKMGARAGELKQGELKMLDAVLHFDDVTARQIMVPRTEAVWFEVDEALEVWLARARESKHTRFPLCRSSLDHVLGLVHTKDLLGKAPDDVVEKPDIVRPIERVPETLPVSRLLRQMQESHRHMSLVVDEFGTVVGLVTLENVLELIVGALQDEFDAEEPDIAAAGSRQYVVAGWISLDRLNRELGLDLYAPRVDTLSGLLMSKLGRVPRVDDRAELPGVTAQVVEVRGERASRVRLTLVRPVPTAGEDEEESV